MVTEAGCGISREVALKLKEAGVDCIGAGGSGGTSWARIESLGAKSGHLRGVGEELLEWGIPTAKSIQLVREALPDIPIVASGGIGTGIDAAKAIALGADGVGMALPLLSPALESASAVEDVLIRIMEVLKIAMFCIGAVDLNDLQNTKHLVRKGD